MTNALLAMDSGMGLLSMAFESKPIHGPLLAPPDGGPVASLEASAEFGLAGDDKSEGEPVFGTQAEAQAGYEADPSPEADADEGRWESPAEPPMDEHSVWAQG
jgi:hypothetical protein